MAGSSHWVPMSHLKNKSFSTGVQFLCALIFFVFISSAYAAYPDRLIKVVVPFPAGGTNDVLARKMAYYMEPYLKYGLIVDNKPGGNGILGVEQVAKATADGYTLLFNSSAMVATQAINPTLQYDTLRDFIPISEAMSIEGYLMLVSSNSPYSNLKEVLNAAQAQPNSITYGSPGIGGSQHLLTESLSHESNIKLTHVPYKGIPDMITAAIREDVTFVFINPLLAIPQIQSGKLKAIAAIGKDTKRLKSAPDIPAISETVNGFYWVGSRFGLFAPAKTPDNIITILQDAAKKAVQDPEFKAYLLKGGFIPIGGSSQEFSNGIQSDLKRYKAIVKSSNIQSN